MQSNIAKIGYAFFFYKNNFIRTKALTLAKELRAS